MSVIIANAMTPVRLCNMVIPAKALQILLLLEWVEIPNRMTRGVMAVKPVAR
jgi:hypothetical protein